jgi:hypothetical protein
MRQYMKKDGFAICNGSQLCEQTSVASLINDFHHQ